MTTTGFVSNVAGSAVKPLNASQTNQHVSNLDSIFAQVEEKAATGETFIILLGINKYAPNYYGQGNNLNFCVNDAVEMERFFNNKKAKSKYWKNINIITLTDEKATTTELKKLFEDISQRDPKMVFFYDSSHGSNIKSTPYLCLHDRMYSIDEFAQDRKQYFPDAQFIFGADTCYSGGFAMEKSVSRGAKSRFFKAPHSVNFKSPNYVEQYMKNIGLFKDGDIALAACRSDQTSLELPKLQHGVWTKALLEGAYSPGEVDKNFGNGDGVCSIEEVQRYTQERVPELLKKYFPNSNIQQNPVMLDTMPDVDQPLEDVAE